MEWKDGDTSRDSDKLWIKWGEKIIDMNESMTRILKSPTGQSNFTLNPADGTVWNFENPEHRRAAFLKHSKDGQGVYFYAVTNGDETVSLRVKIEYAKMLEEGTDAYIGRWMHGGEICIDAVRAVNNGMDDARMRDILIQYNQKAATKLEAKYDKKGNMEEICITYMGVWDE